MLNKKREERNSIIVFVIVGDSFTFPVHYFTCMYSTYECVAHFVFAQTDGLVSSSFVTG